jgi:hypothetical protein
MGLSAKMSPPGEAMDGSKETLEFLESVRLSFSGCCGDFYIFNVGRYMDKIHLFQQYKARESNRWACK